MANITYIEANGQSTTVNLLDGWSLMQGATANGIDGILGECGGSCACATCHCYVDEARLADLPPPAVPIQRIVSPSLWRMTDMIVVATS